MGTNKDTFQRTMTVKIKDLPRNLDLPTILYADGWLNEVQPFLRNLSKQSNTQDIMVLLFDPEGDDDADYFKTINFLSTNKVAVIDGSLNSNSIRKIYIHACAFHAVP